MKNKMTKSLSAIIICTLIAVLMIFTAEARTGNKISVGDINLDGIITVEDARLVLRQALGRDPITKAEEETQTGPVEETTAQPVEETTAQPVEETTAQQTETEAVISEEITAEQAEADGEKKSGVATSDANLNGVLTVTDARYLLRVAIGLNSYYTSFSENHKTVITKNKDGSHTVTLTKSGTTYTATEPCRYTVSGESTATCTKAGTIKYKCTVCGSVTTEKTPATGHSYTGKAIKNGDGTHYYKCLNGCGAVTKAEKCKIVSSVKTEARCGVKGTTLYECAYCGYSYTKTNIPALKHSFSDYVSDGNATWLKDGTKTARCTNPGCKETKTVTDKGSKLDTSKIPSDVKVLYLTFDDGPSTYTDDILKILKDKGAKATWFVIHNSAYTSCLKQIVDAGHSIGLHAYSHDYSKIYSSTTAFYNDLQKISDEVYNYTGVRTKLYRFPGGSSNTVSRYYCSGIMSSLTKSIQQKGYVYFDWNAANNDATGQNLSADGLYRAAISFCGNNRVVMLMHDSGDKYNTVASLGRIIDYYQARGYYCLALDEHSETAHHGVAN